jgi:hypothetical protein
MLECNICYGEFEKMNNHFFPCGHNAGCDECSKMQMETRKECSVCRSKIERVIKIYGAMETPDEKITSPRTAKNESVDMPP